MDMNELIQKNIKLANDYNELLQENINLVRKSKKLNYDNNVLRGAYETRLARYTALEKKLNECYGMYATLKKHYNDLQDRYYESYEDLQDKYNELQNSFEESQDDLAAAGVIIKDRCKVVKELREELHQMRIKLDEVEEARDKWKDVNNHLVSQLKQKIEETVTLREELRQMRIRLDEVEEARDNWKTEAIRRQNELNDIEMRNLMREKPAQECCSHCDKTGCSDCPICPF